MFSLHTAHGLVRLGVLLALLHPLVTAKGPYKSLGDIFDHELAGLQHRLPGNPYLGAQEFGHCCLLAVNESLEIRDGYLAFQPGQTMLHGNISTLESYSFPCTASYNGTMGDQPQVTVSYSWCNRNCPGWELAQPDNYGAWIGPLTAFIVPAIVFCLNISRRRRFEVPASLFPRSHGEILDFFKLLVKIPLACIIVTADILMWLSVLLSMSGPTLLSSAYEALLDLRVLRYIAKQTELNHLSVRGRAHLLYIVLLGNLDEKPAWKHSCQLVSELPDDISFHRDSAQARDVVPVATVAIIEATKTRLKSMLESQTTFGSAVGASIVFFTGGFVYALIELETYYGSA